MRKESVILMLAALCLISCKTNKKDISFRTERSGGVQHVYNTGEPVKGKTTLAVTETLRIEASEIDPADPPLFQTAVKDDRGDLYLADHENVRICKFDSGGRLVGRFLRKGQGPGEFPRLGDVQIVNDHVWVIGAWPLKIAEFTLEGRFIDEWRFPSFRNFYLRTLVIAPDRFLTVSYREGIEGRQPRRVSALINPKEEFLTQFYEDDQAGVFRIRIGQPDGPAIASTDPLIAADIHHAYDRRSGTVFVGNNRDYEIAVKNFDGTTRLVIHRLFGKIGLDEAAKDAVLHLIVPRIPTDAKPSAMGQLPQALNAFWGMTVLPNGHLAVKRIAGLESVEIDLFDREGRLVYTILPSPEVPDLRAATIFRGGLGAIFESGTTSVYAEYKVRNLEGILD